MICSSNLQSEAVRDLFKEAALMEISELKKKILSDFQKFLQTVIEVNHIRFGTSREPQQTSDVLCAILTKNGNLHQSEQLRKGLQKVCIVTDERDQDSTNIANICSQWTGCTPNGVSNTYIDNMGCIADAKKAITGTYIASILAYESALARKSEEERITKHLTGLAVTTAAEETEIELDDFPAVHSKKALKEYYQVYCPKKLQRGAPQHLIKKETAPKRSRRIFQ